MPALAQTQGSITVTGYVKDATGESLIGATVQVKGVTGGTITDVDGNYMLKNVPARGILVFSFVGMQNKEVAVNGKKTINVTLSDDTQQLEQVVVIGYGSVKKSDVTGSVASVKTEALKEIPANSVEGLLQGRAAGLQVINSSQDPGADATVRIRGGSSLRGSNSPLVVVDGFPLGDAGDLKQINPSDIVNIEILKDASASAIYGSRGANGVILVTTKKGKEGRVTLNYSGSVTFETLHDVTDMMSASEWLDYARLAKYNMGAYGNRDAAFAPSYEADRLAFGGVAASWANIDQAWSNGNYDPSKVGSYNWTDHGKQTGITHEHTLSASGGSDKFQGYASFGYLNQKDSAWTSLRTLYTKSVI